MTHDITIDGDARGGAVRITNFTWAEHAYLGEIGQGRVVVDDAAGTLVVPGYQGIHATESDSTPSRIFTGFTHRKGIRRGASLRTAASREYEIATLDGNDLLRRRIIRDGKRPKETITARTAWLLDNELSLVNIADYGRVQSSSVKLDKMDHRGQYPIDVLTGIAKAVIWNFYVRWNEDEAGWELVLRDDNSSTDDTCTLEISNVIEDLDTTILPPFQDAELAEDPEHVYSGTYATGAKGHVYEVKASTADEFTARDGVTEDVGARADSTLSRDARRFLNNSDTEAQLLPVHLQLPKEQVGLIQVGQRILTRMTHMAPEGWDDGETGQYGRIVRLRRSQPTNTHELYDLNLELVPQEDGAGGSACPYELTEAGTFYPLGGFHSADVPPTPNISNGPMYYIRPGFFYPTVPTENHQGMWHFGLYGDDIWGVVQPGGPGTIDWAGDCALNELRFIFVGAGHFSLQTEIYSSGIRPMAAYYGTGPAGADGGFQTFSSGDLLEIDLTGDCVNIIHVMDGPGSPCGGKWGWSVAGWTPT